MPNLFPYTNTHELNLDWILQVVKDFQTKYTTFDQALADALAAIESGKVEALDEISTDLTAALNDITASQTAALTAIGNSKDSALADIGTALTNATNAISALNTTVQAEITTLRNTSISEITTAQGTAISAITASMNHATTIIEQLYNTLPASAQDILGRLYLLDNIITGNTMESFTWLQGGYVWPAGQATTPPTTNTTEMTIVSSRYMTGVGGRRIRIITDDTIKIQWLHTWKNTPPGDNPGAIFPDPHPTNYCDIVIPLDVTAFSIFLSRPSGYSNPYLTPADIPGHIEIQWITDFVSQRIIAPKESSSTADVAREKGEYFFLEGELYIATDDIAVGDTIAEGTNCEKVSVGGELSELKSALSHVDNAVFGAAQNETIEWGANKSSYDGYFFDNSYRWVFPYLFRDGDKLLNLHVSALNVQNAELIVEFWEIENGELHKASRQTVTVTSNENTLQYATISINYTFEADGYVSFLKNQPSNTLARSNDPTLDNVYKSKYLPRTGDSFQLSELGTVGLKMLAYAEIEKATLYNVIQRVKALENESIVVDQLITLKNKVIIVDVNGGGDYTSVVQAVASAQEGDTVIVKPGTYWIDNGTCVDMKEKTIYLKGVDKESCVIIGRDGRYDFPIVWASAGLIENLTLWARYYSGQTIETGTYAMQAYALHYEREFAKGKKLTIRNCKLISDFSSGIGAGLRKNATLQIENCIIETRHQEGRGSNNYGALFFHDSIGEQGHSIINCYNNIFLSTDHITILMSRSVGGENTVDYAFVGNTIYDSVEGFQNNVITQGEGFSTAFTLAPYSNANTNNILNNTI